MTFAAAPVVGDLASAKYLKIVSRGAVYNNLSEDSSAWELIKKLRKGPAEGREMRFALRSGYGAGSVGPMPPTGGDYPTAHRSAIVEGTGRYKDYALTVELENTVVQKALSDIARYGQPLVDELEVKGIALSRYLSSMLYSDGTGVLATANGTGSITNGVMTLSIKNGSSDRGFIGHIQDNDKILIKATDGAAHTPTGGSGTFAYWLVNAVDRDALTVTMTSYNTAGAIMANSATVVTSGDYLYKANQTTFNDLTAISTNDYNTISESIVGLESLGAADGRVVNGITMSGALAGSQKDASGASIDSRHLQQLLSKIKLRAGGNRYKFDRALMAHETLDALVQSREVDRKFVDVKDGKRGVEGLGYIHGNSKLVFTADEFCPMQRIWVIPTDPVLQFHGSDFDFVDPNGNQKFHLTPSANGGFQRTASAMMEGSGMLLGVHGAAIGSIRNFSIT